MRATNDELSSRLGMNGSHWSRIDFAFELYPCEESRSSLIIGNFSKSRYPNGFNEELDAEKLFGSNSIYVASLSQTNDKLDCFTFVLSPNGQKKFGSRKTFINEVGRYVNIE